MDEELKRKILPIKLLILDVDGVLTDGSIIYTSESTEVKSFDVKDGHGIKLLMRSGVDVALLTARESEIVNIRARDLGIKDVYQGQKEKLSKFEEILSKYDLKPEEAAYMGDDLIDLPVLTRVGFSASVSDAVEEIKDSVDYVTERPGGHGAAREVAELILKAKGEWEAATERYYK